jgi:hypothetical protein
VSTENQQTVEDIAWHPAFLEAIQRELAQYKDILQFISEYQLTAEPLRIDVVIIKKLKDIPIMKNIAAIFRIHNLLEYKSPTDYLAVMDFYKVYGYACLYMFLNKIGIGDLTLTFVTSRYPRKLLTHLEKVRGYRIDDSIPGIYTVIGDIFPIQIIDSRKLSEAENIWLKDLDNTLNVARINRLTKEIERLGKAAQVGAYLDAIARANAEMIKESIKMSKSTVTLEQVLIETGLVAKWKVEGKVEGKAEVARNLVKLGVSPKKVAQATEMDIEAVKALIQR